VSVLVTIAIVLLLLFIAGALYDRLGRLRRNVQRTWQHLERHRHARQAIIGRVIEACAKTGADATAIDAAAAALSNAARSSGPPDGARKEQVLGDAVGQLLTTSAIAIDATVGALARELAEAEQSYRSAREAYNDTARRYNTLVTTPPGSWLAGFGKFRRAELFERSAAAPGA
jgi:hypothetical protein